MARVTGVSAREVPPGVRRAAPLFNPLVLPLAGTRLLPLCGVIEHHGRRSGRVYHTPVVVWPTAYGFVVPLPWGGDTDWCRNVRAAGGCVVRWKRRDYPMVRTEVVGDPADARSDFGAFERFMMTRLAVFRCLRLRHHRAGS